jgi:predicted nucleic acid-binding protein
MSGETFTLDTNVLVYSVDRTAGIRHLIAKDVVLRAALLPCWLTLQSASEFYVVVTRKSVMLPSEARSITGAMIDLFRTAAPSEGAVHKALAHAASRRASYWDALLIATAAEAGCTAILTEDLADATTLEGVRVINPFGERGLSPEAEALLSIN